MEPTCKQCYAVQYVVQREKNPDGTMGAQPDGAKYHVKNLHATVLNQMGLDQNKLSYFYGGLDQKLVGVEGADIIPGLT